MSKTATRTLQVFIFTAIIAVCSSANAAQQANAPAQWQTQRIGTTVVMRRVTKVTPVKVQPKKSESTKPMKIKGFSTTAEFVNHILGAV